MKEINRIIEKVTEKYPYKKLGDPSSYSNYNQGWEDACDELGNKIREYLKQKNYE